MNKQAANTVMMIRPVDFSFNSQTAASNAFQNADHGLEDDIIKKNAEKEFDNFVQLLKANGIEVIIFNDTAEPSTPDSIFPNNWISLDQQGRLAIFPMQAINRRLERRKDIIDFFKTNYRINKTEDLTGFETEEKYLEGTGSMVIDYVNDIMYACLSPRTNKTVVDEFCKAMNYKACTFTAVDQSGKEIYHTNVMMCIAEKLVMICLESISNENEKIKLIDSFRSTGHEIINISFEQMNHFAGNMLEVCNQEGKHFLVMSAQAFSSLDKEQIAVIEKFDIILAPAINTIETIGGGGVRCMMAEVFPEKK
ncbi:MAG: arginine deiminase-related protein [Ferruginibacter sp.]